MNNRNKLIELFIYIVIVVVGIVLLLTGGADDKTSTENMGGESYALVPHPLPLSCVGNFYQRWRDKGAWLVSKGIHNLSQPVKAAFRTVCRPAFWSLLLVAVKAYVNK